MTLQNFKAVILLIISILIQQLHQSSSYLGAQHCDLWTSSTVQRNRYYLVLVSHETGFPSARTRQGKASHRRSNVA